MSNRPHFDALPAIPPNKLLIGSKRDDFAKKVIAAYSSEEATLREIAVKTGRSYGFIRRILTESNVTLRPRGGSYSREGKTA